MKIHELKIAGFKSIGEITLVEPNPFSVFVGPNGAGKSNIFEALELFELCNITFPSEAVKLFGNIQDILNTPPKSDNNSNIQIDLIIGELHSSLKMEFGYSDDNVIELNGSSNNFGSFNRFNPNNNDLNDLADYLHFSNYTRLFVNESKSRVKRNLQDDSRLASDASNLVKVLKRIFKNENIKDEIIETLQLLIPGFSNLEIVSESLSGTDNIVVYEKDLKKPLTTRLISDGTYNIIAILAAVYQSEDPQFLCIEEPENGLNPLVIRLLGDIFRNKCKEKGHYIWLNTHSQSLVSELTPDEIILVDKVKGLTQIKQIKGRNLHGLKMDDALFTNVLGGGIPW